MEPGAPDNTYPLPIENLRLAGDPRDTFEWKQGNPDYVKQFGLGPEDIAVLLEIAKGWTDNERRPEGDVLYAPVHAWRALGQLRAVEAIEPLLAVQNALDERGDDWYLEEFHDVWGMIGLPAITALAAYLGDMSNREFPRVSVAHGLCEVVKRNPVAREQVVSLISEQLARHEQDAYNLNGLLVSYLLDLGASEAAETMERAYAAGVVDESICGEWSDVRVELGVEGLGLVPERSGRPRNRLFMPDDYDLSPLAPDDSLRQRKQQQQKEKAKRKQGEKAKKRNRKRK
jgi:hypothetical protein